MNQFCYDERQKILVYQVYIEVFLYFAAEPYQPGHRWRSSNDDIGKIYDSATPNPTGSLSGPWIDEGYGSSKNVTGNATEMLSILSQYLSLKI